MEVVADTWVGVSVVADSMAVAATVAVSAATTVDIAAELMAAVIAVAHTLEATVAEGDMAAHIQAGERVHPDHGHGKAARVRRGTLLRVGTGSREITAR